MSEQRLPYLTQKPEIKPIGQWQTEIVRLIERQVPEHRPFVIVLRGDGQGRLFVHGDGGAPSIVRLK